MIVDQIRKKILMGSLLPGEQLPPEIEMAKQMAVSRSSVREALKILEGFGVIERRKRGGTFIRHVTIDDLANIYTPKADKDILMDLLETREILEMKVIQLVIQRASDEEIIELEKTVDWMIKDREKAAQNDIVFHITLARISKNNVISSVIHSIKSTTEKIFPMPIEADVVAKVFSEHKQIVNAIKKRDVENAQKCLRIHFETVRKQINKYV